ncbi:thioredoxin family protein [Patescibacteria group bacterium]|nr:thioredoxin family protein [Patescibacteria group bacterium]
MSDSPLLMFYEDNCEPCVVVEPFVTRLEKELDVKINRLEAMNNRKNRQLLEKHAGLSMVPFFYNKKTGKKIAGETDYETLKKWALGKND